MFFCQVTHFIVVGDLYSAFPSLGLQLYIRPSVTTHFLVLPCQPSHKQKTVQVNTFSHQDLVTTGEMLVQPKPNPSYL